ncbi:MAG: GspH/FimT family pseudopilin [Paraglaciecola chathamensis]|jgi:Tfp pilus assembly protein FimT
MNTCHGMSLLELMLVISITMILMTLGVPSLLDSKQQLHIKQATQASYFFMQHARASAIASSEDVFVSIHPGQSWCLGMNVSQWCDCQIDDDCSVHGVQARIAHSDYASVSLLQVRFGQNNSAVFDGERGMAMGNSGSVTFGDANDQLKLILSNMGRVRMCVLEGNILAHPAC